MPNSPVPPVDTFQAALHYACRSALFDISDTSLGKPIRLWDARRRCRSSPFESPRSRSELTAIVTIELFYLVCGLCEFLHCSIMCSSLRVALGSSPTSSSLCHRRRRRCWLLRRPRNETNCLYQFQSDQVVFIIVERSRPVPFVLIKMSPAT